MTTEELKKEIIALNLSGKVEKAFLMVIDNQKKKKKPQTQPPK